MLPFDDGIMGVGTDNGLMRNRWQAIIWTYGGLVKWRIYLFKVCSGTGKRIQPTKEPSFPCPVCVIELTTSLGLNQLNHSHESTKNFDRNTHNKTVRTSMEYIAYVAESPSRLWLERTNGTFPSFWTKRASTWTRDLKHSAW